MLAFSIVSITFQTLFGFRGMGHNKYHLTDEQLKSLLMVSTVIRGARVKNEENDNEAESSNQSVTTEETPKQHQNDETQG